LRLVFDKSEVLMLHQNKIFLSHSWEYKHFVEKLKVFLESIGLQVWLDNYEIVGGDNVISRIVDGIIGCDFFSLVSGC
jgi:hypothetical protein